MRGWALTGGGGFGGGHVPPPIPSDSRTAQMLNDAKRHEIDRYSRHGHRPPKRPRRGPGLVRRIARFLRGGGD